MIRPAARVCLRLLAGLAAGLAVIALLAAWRLSQGPVSLAFLTPVVEDVLNERHTAFRIRLDDTVIAWEGWERTLGLHLVNARAVDAEGRVLARVPELSLSLSARAMARGLLAPAEITLYRPTLRLRLDGPRYQVLLEETSASEDLLNGILRELLAPPAPGRAMSYLERIDVIDGNLAIEDSRLGTPWRAPVSHARLWRIDAGLKCEILLTLVADGAPADVVVMGEYSGPDERLDLALAFGSLRPAAYARIAPPLRILDAVDAPVRGTITVSARAGRMLESVGFDLSGGAGHLALPVPIAAELGLLPWAQRTAVREFALRGRYDEVAGRLDIDHAQIAFDGSLFLGPPFDQEVSLEALGGRGRYRLAGHLLEVDELRLGLRDPASVLLPPPIGHRLPLRSAFAQGRYLGTEGRLELSRLELDLDGPTAAASGLVTVEPFAAEIEATLAGLRVDDLERYWPRALVPGGHDWSTAHLSDGVVSELRLGLGMGVDANGETTVHRLDGAFAVDGLSIDYLPPLPRIRAVSGTATFGTDRFSFTTSSGQAEGVVLREGRVDLTGLDGDAEIASIAVVAEGTVPEAFALIDHEPLGYARAVGIEPARTDGRATVRLNLRFPLLNDLALDEIEVTAAADLANVRIADAVLGRDISDGTLTMAIDKQGVDLAGVARMESIEGRIAGRENFSADAPFRRRIEVRVAATAWDEVQRLLFGRPALPRTIIDGSLESRMRFTELWTDGGVVEADFDLADTSVEVPVLGWTKARGEGASARISGRIGPDRVFGIPEFSLTGEGLVVAGSADFDGENRLERVDLARFEVGRSDVAGWLRPLSDGGWVAVVRGRTLDVAPLWRQLDAGIFSGIDVVEDDGGTALTVDLETLWLTEDRGIGRLSGTFVRTAEGIWSKVRADGLADDGSPISASIDRGDDTGRVLDVRAANAGAALRTLGVFDNMSGGTLRISGSFADDRPSHPLDGRLEVRDYRVLNAPVLARVLSAVALTGLGDALGSDGLSFSRLEVPFTLSDGVLSVRDARASGFSLGFTASGTLDVASRTLDLGGTVVPMYAINSALGHLPLVGPWLTGGEKGGGVFAAAYTMKGPLDKPDIAVNALSALAPGYLRELLVFGGAATDDRSPELPLRIQGNDESP